MANLIGRVVFEPVAVRPGESVRVEVFGPDDTAIDPAAAVTIDGVPGAVRHLQYATPGARRLFVRARGADGKVESTVADLEVAGAPLEFATIEGGRELAMIGVTQDPARPYAAVLTLGPTADVRTPRSPTLRTPGQRL